MSDKTILRFGKYLILDHLVDGGMATIYRARFLGEQADKVVVIKVVKPEFSKNDAFQKMFVDEVKVCFGFAHSNIVQTFDYGIYDEQLYVAMEYCDGRNLKEYIGGLKDKKSVFPVDISMHIAVQVCQGLYYAHKFKDKLTGKELNLIHRDISPSNIMLNYDGAVKIIDFGIAKAETNSEETQAGTIKGKMSYLAPEYLEGAILDHRYDQFAVGIIIWEMLCGRKLFTGSNDLATLKVIQECKVPPPSTINKKVPPELDAIILKALSKDRENRYDNMDHFARALNQSLYATYPNFGSSDIAHFAEALFRDDIKEDQKKMVEYGKVDTKRFLEELKKDEGKKRVKRKGKKNRKEKELVVEEGSMITSKSLGAGVDVGKLVPIEKKFGPTLPSLKSGIKSATKVRKKHSRSQIPSSKANSKVAKGNKGKGKKIATIVAVLGGIYIANNYFNSTYDEGESPNRVPAQKRDTVSTTNDRETTDKVASQDRGKITLNNFDRYKQKVYIDGSIVKPDVFSSISVAAGKDLFLRVESHRRRSFVTKVNVGKGGSSTILVPDQPLEDFVRVTSNDGCTSGMLSFKLYGEPRKVSVPFSRGFILLPLKGDGSDSSEVIRNSTLHTMYFMEDGSKVEKRVRLKIGHSADSVDICSIL